ncbi:uncharacterized protein LOC143190415 isoform X1 [Rhynchophorus ferrugineus]|uniref:uncharacterized protein LOC143190415 isoform X1 n=2 Tax=Rhynchophorus ferrugineus TaxID=354439 RepID=UPI003FCE6CBB
MKMYGNRNFTLLVLVTINFLFNGLANAGIMKRSSRMVREVYPPDVEPENESNQAQVCIVGDVVYGAEEPVPAEQPCLKCRCRPPGVQCETVQCAKKAGCKAIHRPNRCCPDYQCVPPKTEHCLAAKTIWIGVDRSASSECEHNGKIYANGEKLETNPGGECKVCYCRGGEIQCAEVSCYIRNDCEGKRVPGTCCPKYDHCPPIDSVLNRSSTTEIPTNTLKPLVLELWKDASTNSTQIPQISTPSVNTIPEENNKVPDTEDITTIAPTFAELPNKDEGMLPRITIQEIIPERKEIPITAPPKNFITDLQGTLLIEEAIPTSENTSNDLNIDTDPESSEVSEVFQHPPPILRIGDKLLFLKKGELVPEKDTSSPQTVITIIGAEGLQRGGVEDSLEIHEVKIDPESNIQHISKEVIEPELEVTSENDADIEIEALPTTQPETKKEDPESNDLELKFAESTHILSLLKKNNPGTESNIVVNSSTEQLPQKSENPTTIMSSIDKPHPTEDNSAITTTLPEITTDSIDIVTSPSSTSSTEASTEIAKETLKQIDLISDQNPAYPPLPDVMPEVGDASQKFEIELENDNATTMEIKILPEVFGFLNNKTQAEKNASHSEWLKSGDGSDSIPTYNYKELELPEDLLKQKSAIDEDETTTTERASIESTTNDDLDITKAALNNNATNDQASDMGPQLIAEVRIDDLKGPSEDTGPIMEIPKETEDLLKETFKSVTNMSDVSDEKDIPLRSIESLELFESKEQTTPKINFSSIIIDENASAEKAKEEPSSEAGDMLMSASGVELGSVEIANPDTKSISSEVELLDKTKSAEVNVEVMKNDNEKDVEFINVLNTPKPTKSDKIESSTYELLPTPEETKSKISKRDVSPSTHERDIFKELEKELNSESAISSKTETEEKAEADQIFKELLEESNGEKVNTRLSRDQQTANSVGNAVAGLLFKGKSPDPGIFTLIGRLFTNQQA